MFLIYRYIRIFLKFLVEKCGKIYQKVLFCGKSFLSLRRIFNFLFNDKFYRRI